MKKPNPAPNREAVLALLKKHGPLSIASAAKRMGWTSKKVADTIARTRLGYPKQFFRIADYQTQDGARLAPCYSAGAGEDVPCVRRTKEDYAAQKKVWRERKMAERRSESRVRVAPKPAPKKAPKAKPLNAKRLFVAAHYCTMPTKDIAQALGISTRSVNQVARRLGLSKPAELISQQRSKALIAKNRSRWSPPLLEVLDLMFPAMTNAQVAELLGMPQSTVSNHAYARGLRKDQSGAEEAKAQKQQAAKQRAAKKRGAAAAATAAKAEKKAQAEAQALALRIERQAQKAAAAKPKQAPALKAAPSVKAPPPMTQAMRDRMARERFHYPPGTLPWRAESMFGAVYVPKGAHTGVAL